MTHTRLAAGIYGLSAIAYLAFVFSTGAELPQRIATHFDAEGHANGWMGRGTHLTLVTVFPLLKTALVIAVCWAIRLAPSTLNVPRRDVWRAPSLFPVACRRILIWSFWFGVMSFAWWAWLHSQVVYANSLPTPSIPASQPLLGSALYLTCIALSVGVLMLTFRRRRQA